MSCGAPPLSNLTPPFVFSNFTVSLGGTVNSFITIDGNDHFNNGLYDDNTFALVTTVAGTVINFATCGNPAPVVGLVSRNRLTLIIPNITTSCDAWIGISTTWTGLVWFKCGNPSSPPPVVLPAANTEITTPASTGGSGCSSTL